MLTEATAAAGMLIFTAMGSFIAGIPLGLIIFILSWLINRRMSCQRRISLAYAFFVMVGSSIANSVQFTFSMATNQISDPPIMTALVWYLLYNLYFIATIVINLIPTELFLKRRYPQSHRHYHVISISAVVFLNLISWAIVFYRSEFSLYDSVLFYLVWAPGFAAGLGVFNYIMRKVPPRSLVQASTPKGSNSASPEPAG